MSADVLADFDHAKLVSACAHEIGAGHDHVDGLDHSSCGARIGDLGDEALGRYLAEHRQWSLRDGRLRRRYDFDTFDSAMQFVETVARLSREANHHPDIHLENKRTVYLVLWTHKAQAITELDLSFARAVEDSCPGGGR